MALPSNTTNYAEIQRLEVEALEAIYMEDFQIEEAKTGPWNKRVDCKFRLKLWPQIGQQEAELFAILSVILPTTYPKSLPHLDIICGGLVPQKVEKKIRFNAHDKAKSLLGYESIHEIAIMIQELLDEAVESIAEAAKIPDLNKQRAQREAAVLQAAEAARNAQFHEQEVAKKKQDLALSALVERESALQARLRPSRAYNVNPSFDESESIEDSVSNIVRFDQEMTTRLQAENVLVTFKHVNGLSLLRRGPLTIVYTARPVTNAVTKHDTPPGLLMKTCEMGKGWEEEKIKFQIASRLEPGLQSTQGIPFHRNVLPTLGFQIQSAFTDEQARVWTVRILMEFVSGGSLLDSIKLNRRVDADIFRTLLIQILEGLQHLHSHNVVHGRLHLKNLLVEYEETGNFTIKLSDYSYQAELHHLNAINARDGGQTLPSSWNPPEISNESTKRVDSTEDIWYLGVVSLQLLFGYDVHTRYESPTSLLQELHVTASLEQMLLRMFHPNPAKRPSCFSLLASTFLRSDEKIVETGTSPSLSRIPSNQNTLIHKLSRARHNSTNNSAPGISRYIQDFSEHAKIGKGGFGMVVRARNKIDGQWYAIKQIVSESAGELQSVLSEAMLLSRLSHPHVVRYVTAWLEDSWESDSANAILSDSDSIDSGGEVLATTQKKSRLSFSNHFSSNQGLDYISSGAHIKFDEDDSENENVETQGDVTSDGFQVKFDNSSCSGRTESDEQQAQKDGAQNLQSGTDSTKRTLYIQMEFCENQTLRDLIREDLASRPDDYWRILRQITSALDHVHSQGIIHRDLKPENVFVTQGRSNVRLGDFGLAKPQSKNIHKGVSGNAVGPLTASVGTSVYIAPEVRSSGGGVYDEKVDMYSLGIILFEMCYALETTAMERSRTLENLRKKQFVFPVNFESSAKLLERDLIAGLIDHTPGERLSAAALFERIPVDADDNALRRLIEGLSSDRNDPMHRKLVRQLFTSSPNDLDVRSYTYDLELAKEASNSARLHFHSIIKKQLTTVFQNHGAVEDDTTQIFVPSNDVYGEPVKVMATDGAILQLPYDLIVPRARRLAKQQALGPCKTYTFSSVFRRNGTAHPRTFDIVDFDIISKTPTCSARHEAEVLKVVDEIIDVIPALTSRPMRFLVNHSEVLNAILCSCKIPESKYAITKAHLSKLGGVNTTAQIKSELRASEIALSHTAIDDLFRFDFRDSLTEGVKRLRKLLPSTDGIDKAFKNLDDLLKYAKGFGIQREIFLDPLSCCNAEFYRGNLMFQCIFEKRRRAIFCAGGRYDQLVRDNALLRSSQPCHVVGFSLSLSSLVNAMGKYASEPQRSPLRQLESQDDLIWTPRRCDILVDGSDGSVLNTVGLSIVRELWLNNIRAELSDVGNTSDDLGYGEQTDHEIILMIKADGSLRLRGQIRRNDIEVRRSDLVATLRTELRERERMHYGKQSERPRLRHEPSEVLARNAEVSVLWSASRSKKSNRQLIVDEALSKTAEDFNEHLEAPIIAVELKDDTFDHLRETRLADPDSWKKVIQSADPGSRRYLTEIQRLLLEKATDSKGPRSAYLYNFRSKACIYYDLFVSS